MFNKKGFITIEAVFYISISLILIMVLSNIIQRSIKYQNNEKIKILQSFNILRQSVIKYKTVKFIDNKHLLFDNETQLKINKNHVYETPGFMPYFQNIKKAYFKYIDRQVILSFVYNNIIFEQVIFYDK